MLCALLHVLCALCIPVHSFLPKWPACRKKVYNTYSQNCATTCTKRFYAIPYSYTPSACHRLQVASLLSTGAEVVPRELHVGTCTTAILCCLLSLIFFFLPFLSLLLGAQFSAFFLFINTIFFLARCRTKWPKIARNRPKLLENGLKLFENCLRLPQRGLTLPTNCQKCPEKGPSRYTRKAGRLHT